MPTAEEMAQVTALLKDNRIQDAADLSAKLTAQAKAAEDLAAGKIPEPPPPREVAPIVYDLLHEFAAHLGHTPRMQSLINELDEATARLH